MLTRLLIVVSLLLLNNMTDLQKLGRLSKKYGKNFLNKCCIYTTAMYKDEYVSLIHFVIEDMRFYIEKQDKTRAYVKVTELDHFCL